MSIFQFLFLGSTGVCARGAPDPSSLGMLCSRGGGGGGDYGGGGGSSDDFGGGQGSGGGGAPSGGDLDDEIPF